MPHHTTELWLAILQLDHSIADMQTPGSITPFTHRKQTVRVEAHPNWISQSALVIISDPLGLPAYVHGRTGHHANLFHPTKSNVTPRTDKKNWQALVQTEK